MKSVSFALAAYVINLYYQKHVYIFMNTSNFETILSSRERACTIHHSHELIKNSETSKTCHLKTCLTALITIIAR